VIGGDITRTLMCTDPLGIFVIVSTGGVPRALKLELLQGHLCPKCDSRLLESTFKVDFSRSKAIFRVQS